MFNCYGMLLRPFFRQFFVVKIPGTEWKMFAVGWCWGRMFSNISVASTVISDLYIISWVLPTPPNLCGLDIVSFAIPMWLVEFLLESWQKIICHHQMLMLTAILEVWYLGFWGWLCFLGFASSGLAGLAEAWFDQLMLLPWPMWRWCACLGRASYMQLVQVTDVSTWEPQVVIRVTFHETWQLPITHRWFSHEFSEPTFQGDFSWIFHCHVWLPEGK